MSTRNLDAIFRPKTIALVGASNREGAVGWAIARNLYAGGFAGPILAVSQHEPAIGSVLSYRSVAELPLAPDLAVLATPPAAVPASDRRAGPARLPRGDRDRRRARRGRGTRRVETLRQADAGRRAAAHAAHHRTQLPGLPVAGRRASTPASPTWRRGRRRRLRRAVRRAGDGRARLGGWARPRLLPHRLARRHGRRRLRRHARLARRRTATRSILLYVECVTSGAQVHDAPPASPRAPSR